MSIHQTYISFMKLSGRKVLFSIQLWIETGKRPGSKDKKELAFVFFDFFSVPSSTSFQKKAGSRSKRQLFIIRYGGQFTFIYPPVNKLKTDLR